MSVDSLISAPIQIARPDHARRSRPGTTCAETRCNGGRRHRHDLGRCRPRRQHRLQPGGGRHRGQDPHAPAFPEQLLGENQRGNRRIHFGSRVDVPPGRYQIRLAAVAASGEIGSVFTEVVVPDFGDALALGGLSLASPAAPTAKLAELLASVLPLVPLASPEIPAGTQVVAQLPIRVSSRASGPLTIDAKLARGSAAPQSIDAPAPDVKPFAAAGGSVYTRHSACQPRGGRLSARRRGNARSGEGEPGGEVQGCRAVSLVGRQPLAKGNRRRREGEKTSRTANSQNASKYRSPLLPFSCCF